MALEIILREDEWGFFNNFILFKIASKSFCHE